MFSASGENEFYKINKLQMFATLIHCINHALCLILSLDYLLHFQHQFNCVLYGKPRLVYITGTRNFRAFEQLWILIKHKGGKLLLLLAFCGVQPRRKLSRPFTWDCPHAGHCYPEYSRDGHTLVIFICYKPAILNTQPFSMYSFQGKLTLCVHVCMVIMSLEDSLHGFYDSQ